MFFEGRNEKDGCREGIVEDRTAPASDTAAMRIALIGTFPPRKCGIATFTGDLFEQVSRYHPELTFDVYAIDEDDKASDYQDIADVVASTDAGSWRRAAKTINTDGVDAVWLQHEYGIFGGPDGEMVCDFVDRLAAPLILTLHTVLTRPTGRQRAILEHLLARASKIMVMSRHSRVLLAETYGAPYEMIEVIEHGAPDRPFAPSTESKMRMGLDGRPVLMTFGLLGPGKGIEHVLEALPAILETHPRTIYRIVGATHPGLVAENGEEYREGLKRLARQRGVSHAIQWEDRFLGTPELLDQLESCDIYLTPYRNLQQSTSGTLAYAVALGKAVVSTPYIHASELLADDVGILVEPASSDAIADAVIALLQDPERLAATQRRAWNRGRQTIWPRFAEAAAALVRSVAYPDIPFAPLAGAQSLAAVDVMTDATGMLQHAIGIVPDRRHGYCIDDNARALMLVNAIDGLAPAERQARALVHAAFVQHAWNSEAQAFRNFMNFDHSWCEESGSQDSNGRTLWALGQTIECSPDEALRFWARRWYDTALPPVAKMRSPRTVAFVMLAAAARLRREPDHRLSRETLRHGGEYLASEYAAASSEDWPWFERRLGYDNPRLPQAMLEAGETLGRRDLRKIGLESLVWLADRQSAHGGQFRPVGSEGMQRDHDILPFDQQPLEAQAAIEAARVALRISGDDYWARHALAAWRWFFGANDRHVILADLTTGRCADGVNPRGRNENCGAESILAFQLARCSMLALRRDRKTNPSTGKSLEPQSRLSEHPLPNI